MMGNLFFGLAFLGSVLMFNQSIHAQASVEPGGGGVGGSSCYQRMYWCGDKVEVYNCETYQTGIICSKYYKQCYKC